MSEDKRRIITLLKRLYAAIKSTNKNVSSIKEDNMVLLWENSSPGSAFAAQTIALDLTDYKWVKIETLPVASTNGKNVTTNEFKCPGAGNTFAPTTRTDVGSSGWWHGGRTVEITTTGITFGQGGFRYSNTTTQTANDSYGIPLRIWGVKKSYSVSLVKDVLPAENGGTGVTSLEELKSKLGVISGGGGSGGGVNKAADLNPDTLIPSGADLNDYLEFGSYLSPRKAVSASLSNCPHTTSGFSLQVIKTSNGGKMQLLTSNGTKCLVYMRHWDVTFSDWVQMGTTVIQKVWENASPDSDFAGQTINLDLSEYTHLWIEYSGLPVCIVQKNVSTDCWSNAVPSLRYRNVIFTNTAVTFKDGGYITAYGGTQKSLNSALRPKIIRGIRGVL